MAHDRFDKEQVSNVLHSITQAIDTLKAVSPARNVSIIITKLEEAEDRTRRSLKED
jgi:hypothetical protein